MQPDLWSFATHCYGQPGVEHACLQLQDAGADVCLLLSGLWLEQRGVPCNAERLHHLHAIAKPWQDQVVRPLRALRQNWRAGATSDARLHALREQVKALELESERELLLSLEAQMETWPADSSHNKPSWLEPLLGPVEKANRDALNLLRAAATTAA